MLPDVGKFGATGAYLAAGLCSVMELRFRYDGTHGRAGQRTTRTNSLLANCDLCWRRWSRTSDGGCGVVLFKAKYSCMIIVLQACLFWSCWIRLTATLTTLFFSKIDKTFDERDRTGDCKTVKHFIQVPNFLCKKFCPRCVSLHF